MLNRIRSISPESHFVSALRSRKAMRFAGQIVFWLYLSLFISDCINIDVLYATIKGGNIDFIDDPSISDSLFDTGSQHHESAFDATVHYNDLQKFAARDRTRGGDRMVKNVIYEDEDSPGIADAVLSSSFATQSELPRPESEFQTSDIIQTLDRTISYQRILI